MAITCTYAAPSTNVNYGSGLIRTSGQFLNNTADWTFCYWMQTLARPQQRRVYTILGDPTASNLPGQSYVTTRGTAAGNDLVLVVGAGDASGSLYVSTVPLNLVPGPWNHVAVTYAHTSHTLSLYLNGSLQASGTINNLNSAVFTQERIGFDATASEGNAGFAYYRSWQSALTATQLKAEMASTSAVITANLFSDVTLATTSTTDLTDVTGNGRVWSVVNRVGISLSPFVERFLTNLTPATAQAVCDLPTTWTQNVYSSSTQTVWYSYLAQPLDTVISVWALGDTSVYLPELTIYEGYPNAITNMPYVIPGGSNTTNCILQVTVRPGFTYYFKVVPNSTSATPAVLKLAFTPAPMQRLTVPFNLAIPGDAEGDNAFPPLGFYTVPPFSALTDFAPPTQFIPIFPYACSSAHLLPGGELTVIGTHPLYGFGTYLYNGAYQALVPQNTPLFPLGGPVNLPWQFPNVVSSDRAHTFYVAGFNIGMPPAVTTVDAYSGLHGPTTWVPTVSEVGAIFALAVNLAGTVLYYVGPGTNADGTDGIVRTWNLVGNAAGPNFATVPAGYQFITDSGVGSILVLADNTVLVPYGNATTLQAQKMLRYSATGTILNTYSLPNFEPYQLAHAPNDPQTFWFWGKDLNDNFESFVQANVQTAAIAADCQLVQFLQGYSQEPLSVSPAFLFGVPNTGPFWVPNINPNVFLTIPAQWALERFECKTK